MMKTSENKVIWKDIPNYEGLYKINNYGEIKNHNSKNMKVYFTTNGYLFVTLHKNGISKRHFIHRLVGFAFLENPENKPQIDHIDGNKTNNDVSNLRWVTAKENCNNPLRVEKFVGTNNHFFGKKHTEETRRKMSKNHPDMSGSKNPAARKVQNTYTLEIFETVKDAGKSAGVSDNSIRNSIKRGYKSAGFVWRYV